MSKNYKKFLQILHQYIDFSLLSSTISSYFNSSYYSFLTFLTLYLISLKISPKKFSHETQWGDFNPQNPPLPTPLIPTMRVHFAKSMCASCGLRILKLRVSSEAGLKMGRNVPEHVRIETACH